MLLYYTKNKKGIFQKKKKKKNKKGKRVAQ